MDLTVSIPDELARRLCAGGGDISRRALEALAAEECRAGRLSEQELSELLGFATRAELVAFWRERQIRALPASDAGGNLAEAIRRRFGPVGGVELEPHPPIPAPPAPLFER
jgi:hypothetical protein